LRAGLVENLKELDKYPWSGHSAIIGKCKNPLVPKKTHEGISDGRLTHFAHLHVGDKKENPENPVSPACPVATEDGTGVKEEKLLAEKTIEDVLLYFGKRPDGARKKYRQFVEDAIQQGHRPEFQGGGLIRSSGGNSAGLLGLKLEDREESDQRILGSGDFVATVIHESEEKRSKKMRKAISLENLTKMVSENLEIAPVSILSSNRERKISKARAVISYLGVREAGYSQTEISKHLNMSRTAVQSSISRAENMLDTCMEIWEKVDYVRKLPASPSIKTNI